MGYWKGFGIELSGRGGSRAKEEEYEEEEELLCIVVLLSFRRESRHRQVYYKYIASM